jgi:hypothetical protein
MTQGRGTMQRHHFYPPAQFHKVTLHAR